MPQLTAASSCRTCMHLFHLYLSGAAGSAGPAEISGNAAGCTVAPTDAAGRSPTRRINSQYLTYMEGGHNTIDRYVDGRRAENRSQQHGSRPSLDTINQHRESQTSSDTQPPPNCPASRTTLVATRFRVAVICPIIQVPHCIRVFFYFVWFVFINHIFQFYYELCTYCNILDIYLS